MPASCVTIATVMPRSRFSSISSFITSAPVLFVYCTFLLGVHFVVVLIGAKLFRIDPVVSTSA